MLHDVLVSCVPLAVFQFPLVRLVLPMVLGIVCAVYFPVNAPVWWFALLAAVIGLISALPIIIKTTASFWRNCSVLGLAIAWWCLGYWNVSNLQHSTQPPDGIFKEQQFLATLIEEPVIKEKTVKVLAEWTTDSLSSSYKIILYLKRDAFSEQLHYGDNIALNATLARPAKAMNPGDFDYRSWCAKKNIYVQAYVQSGCWELLNHDGGNWFKKSALQLRNFFRGQINTLDIGRDEKDVAAALLVGYDEQLDDQLQQAFSTTGTLHVLSVSGMHVALVYVVLMKLLAPFETTLRRKRYSAILQFAFIWFYAVLTGFSPSVLRSVTMLTVIITGRLLLKRSHILNALLASAFILLLFDPLLLFDVGFQLSYAAVAGIVLLQPIAESFYTPDSAAKRMVWTLVSVSVVAQVFTFPLGLYYFGTFPTWFLFANLIIIPASTLALYAGVFFLAVCWIPGLSAVAGYVMSWLITTMNAGVTWISEWPGASIIIGNWTLVELIALYLVIFSMIAAIQSSSKMTSFRRVLMFLAVLIIALQISHVRESTLERTIVHHMRGISAISARSGYSATVLHASPLTRRNEYKDQINNSVGKKVEVEWINADSSLDFRRYYSAYRYPVWTDGHKNIIVYSGNVDQLPAEKLNCLLIRNNAALPPDEWLEQYIPDTIIVDASNHRGTLKRWKNIAVTYNKYLHNTAEQGALILHGR